MPKTILTEELIKQAIELAKPSVESILSQGIGVWGPKYVSVVVSGPGIEGNLDFTLGFRSEWDPKWGPKEDFLEIARQKDSVSNRTGMPTDVVVTRKPWLLEEGDFLYQGGTAGRPGGLTVSVSGAMAQVDEGIADIVYGIVAMLCRLKVKGMQENGINRLETAQ